MEKESHFEKEKKPWAMIEFGVSGHEKEYIVVLENYDEKNYIPSEIEDEIQNALGDDWDVDNRGTRLEIINRKKFGLQDDALVITMVKKILKERGYWFR
ncbi:MAG: hypothetical protein A3G49_04455 [Candidatus Sungbacteria bacterium RIFCSPLOWO2_12_FULL_41_11]|uniref:Uncharacterized protein n=1 Tax=Candidatus Sungbacteria bacterium RIFCSPLOWO2_12_FULL_41_11 TaxID=1802286 RepID=A0A1G2LSI9_9BACT|nr:MAG: hypothetical protein A3G49_04455 [Candidatus Sungbacteria bacterium RIFCSPLOWO2_12_FULL_41_11]